jgi:hypothetical protein
VPLARRPWPGTEAAPCEGKHTTLSPEAPQVVATLHGALALPEARDASAGHRLSPRRDWALYCKPARTMSDGIPQHRSWHGLHLQAWRLTLWLPSARRPNGCNSSYSLLQTAAAAI